MLDRVAMYICPWQPRDVKTSILKTCIFRGGSNANEFYRSTGLDKIILRGTLNISFGEGWTWVLVLELVLAMCSYWYRYWYLYC